MVIGNIVDPYARSAVSEIYNAGVWTYHAVNDVVTGFKYSFENRASELAESTVVILTAAAIGCYVAKTLYSKPEDIHSQYTEKKYEDVAFKAALFSISLACFAWAGFKIYSCITENRTIGRCSTFIDLIIENQGSLGSPCDSLGVSGYSEFGCNNYFGLISDYLR
jgi:hypothetical protein